MAIQGAVEGEWVIEFNILDSAKDRYPDEDAILKGMKDGTLHAEHSFYPNETPCIFVWDEEEECMDNMEKIAEIHTQYIGGSFGLMDEWRVVPDGEV